MQVAAGVDHTVLLRSDGRTLAVGDNDCGQCDVPPLEEGAKHVQVAAGLKHTVLLRNDGLAVAVGENRYGQCDLPLPEDGAGCRPPRVWITPCFFAATAAL